MTRTVHISADIRGLLNQQKGSLKKLLSDDQGRPVTDAEAREALMDELSKGHRYISASGCDNFDPKHGCLGHEKPDVSQTSISNK